MSWRSRPRRLWPRITGYLHRSRIFHTSSKPRHSPIVKRYTHRPIDTPNTIRILRLHPAPDPSSPLHASFVLHRIDPDGPARAEKPAVEEEAFGDEAENYIAVSYTWSPDDAPAASLSPPAVADYVSIGADEGVIHITRTLANFLRNGRRSDRMAHYWIDQLCIQQEEPIKAGSHDQAPDVAAKSGALGEKEQQIPLMHYVYAQATCVVLWVGETDENDIQALLLTLDLSDRVDHSEVALAQRRAEVSAMEKLLPPQSEKDGSSAEAARERRSKLVIEDGTSHMSSDEEMRTGGLPPLSDPVWYHLRRFLERRVFMRLWIFQEVVLGWGTLLVIGTQFVNFEELGKAASLVQLSGWTTRLDYAPSVSRALVESVVDSGPITKAGLRKRLSQEQSNMTHGWSNVMNMWIYRVKFAQGGRQALDWLLLSAMYFQTDRNFGQDRVYALLGLCADAHQQKMDTGETVPLPNALIPDYAKPVSQLYQEVTELCLSKGSVDILCAVEDPSFRSPSSTLPSWVPDYSLAVGQAWAEGSDDPQYGEPGRPELNHAQVIGKTLIVDGARACRVTAVSDIESVDASLTDSFLDRAARLLSHIDLTAPYGTVESQDGDYSSNLDAFWKTLISDTDLISLTAPDYWIHHFAAYVLDAAAGIRFRGVCRALHAQGRLSLDQLANVQELVQDGVFPLIQQRMSEGTGPVIRHWNEALGVEMPFASGSMKDWAPGLSDILWRGLIPLLGDTFWEDGKIRKNLLYAHKLQMRTNFRTFFVTEDGYFGVGPMSTEPGDEVFVMKGAMVPFVLRPSQDGGHEHRVVGFCYVQGIMGGAVMDREDFSWSRVRLV